MKAIHLLSRTLLLYISCFTLLVDAGEEKVIWTDGKRSLTLQELEEYLTTPIESLEKELYYGHLLTDAGTDLSETYIDLIINATDPELVFQAFNSYENYVGDFSPYMTELKAVFGERKEEYTEEELRARYCLLSLVGEDKDGPLLYSKLLDPTDARRRRGAASLLALIGGENTLRDLEAMLPRLEEMHQEDLRNKMADKRLRMMLLDEGYSQEKVDEIFVKACERIKRKHIELRASVDRLREKVRRKKEGGDGEATRAAPEAAADSVEEKQVAEQESAGRITDRADHSQPDRGYHQALLSGLVALAVLILTGLIFRRKRTLK